MAAAAAAPGREFEDERRAQSLEEEARGGGGGEEGEAEEAEEEEEEEGESLRLMADPSGAAPSARPSTLSAADTTVSVGSSISVHMARVAGGALGEGVVGEGEEGGKRVEAMARAVLQEALASARKKPRGRGEEGGGGGVAAAAAAAAPGGVEAPPAAELQAPPPAAAQPKAKRTKLAALFGK